MEQPPPIPEIHPAPAPQAPMSLPARLLNVFAIPGEVFETVKASGLNFSNWLVPILLAFTVGAATVGFFASQPALLEEFRSEQLETGRKLVEAGKMTRADADKFAALTKWITTPEIVKTGGALVVLVFSIVRVFWWALVLWFLGILFLKSRFSFFKALEVAGLGTMISVLGGAAGLLVLSDFGGAQDGLTLKQLLARWQSTLSIVLANVFGVWSVGVMAAGLARLAQAPFARALLLVMTYWILFQFGLALVSLGAAGMAG